MGIVGTFGIVSAAPTTPSFAECISIKVTAALGLRNACSICAQARSARLGFHKVILSTAQIREQLTGFTKEWIITSDRKLPETMTTKQAGGG